MYLSWKVVFLLMYVSNAETEAAMKETRAIAKGEIAAKKYSSAKKMIDDVLAEDSVNA